VEKLLAAGFRLHQGDRTPAGRAPILRSICGGDGARRGAGVACS